MRIVHGQRAETHRVEQLEDRRVGSDAERQRQDRDDRKARIQAQQPRAIPKVAPRTVEKVMVFIE